MDLITGRAPPPARAESHRSKGSIVIILDRTGIDTYFVEMIILPRVTVQLLQRCCFVTSSPSSRCFFPLLTLLLPPAPTHTPRPVLIPVHHRLSTLRPAPSSSTVHFRTRRKIFETHMRDCGELLGAAAIGSLVGAAAYHLLRPDDGASVAPLATPAPPVCPGKPELAVSLAVRGDVEW